MSTAHKEIKTACKKIHPNEVKFIFSCTNSHNVSILRVENKKDNKKTGDTHNKKILR